MDISSLPGSTGSQINRSYFYYNDTTMGWGPAYWFSLYFESNNDGPAYGCALLIILCIMIGCVENAVVCMAVLGLKKLRRAANFYLVNLSISSILYLISGSFVAKAQLDGDWKSGNTACGFTTYVLLACGIISLWTQMFVSLERYRRIIRPKDKAYSHTTVLLTCLFTWLVNAAACSPVFFYSFAIDSTMTSLSCQLDNNVTLGGTHPNSVSLDNGDSCEEIPISVCTFSMPVSDSGLRYSYLVYGYMIVFGWIIPLLVIASVYTKILLVIRGTVRRMNLHSIKTRRSTFPLPLRNISQDTPSTTHLTESHETVFHQSPKKKTAKSKTTRPSSNSPRTHMKSVYILIALVITFILSWAPMFTVLTLIQLETDFDSQIYSSTVFVWTITISYLNACTNPVLYGFVSSNFQVAFTEFRSRWRKPTSPNHQVGMTMTSVLSSQD